MALLEVVAAPPESAGWSPWKGGGPRRV